MPNSGQIPPSLINWDCLLHYTYMRFGFPVIATLLFWRLLCAFHMLPSPNSLQIIVDHLYNVLCPIRWETLHTHSICHILDMTYAVGVEGLPLLSLLFNTPTYQWNTPPISLHLRYIALTIKSLHRLIVTIQCNNSVSIVRADIGIY